MLKKLSAFILSFVFIFLSAGCSSSDKDVAKLLSYIDEGNGESAVYLYNDVIKNDDDKLVKADKELDILIDEIQEKYNNKKCTYDDAVYKLEILKQFDCSKERSEYVYEDIYADNCIEEAKNLSSNFQYTDCLKLLDKSLLYNFKSTDAKNKIQLAKLEIEDEIKHLFKCDSYGMNYGIIFNEVPLQDLYGVNWDFSFFIELKPYTDYKGPQLEDGYVILETGGKFNSLQGSISVMPKAPSDLIYGFDIYADGQRVYSSGNLTAKSGVIPVDIEIGNADKLKIIHYSNYYLDNYCFLTDFILYNK